MTLQAIIMAGGEGVRLRPLTAETPKPLVPLLGEPCVGYALWLLRRHGLTRIGATLWYRPRDIRAALRRGEKWGVNLRYYEETAPLGTAGSVRMAMDRLKDTFFVLSGDGLTDCDLSAALAWHRKKGALATLVLKAVPIPLPYGVVVTDGDGRITRFVEKPGWKKTVSDLVNTGIYILEPEIFRYIPDTGAPDFGKDIFPALVEKGLPVYGFETDAYWCDIGDQKAYLEAQRDLMAGKVDLPLPQDGRSRANIDPGARIGPLCWIGEGASIGPGAVIEGSVIGPGARVGGGVLVENSCLWAKARAEKRARITGSVLCGGALAGTGAELTDGCALGSGAAVGPYALLRPGVKVGPYLKVAPGAVTARSVVSSQAAAPQWSAWGAACDDAEAACALCGAYVQATGSRRVVCGGPDEALRSLAAGALASAGARVLTAGNITFPMLQALVRSLRLEGGVWAGERMLRFTDGAGSPLSPKKQSAVSACVLRQDLPAAFAGSGRATPLGCADEIYLSAILPPDDPRPLLQPVALFCDDETVLALGAEALGRMGVPRMRTGKAEEARALEDEIAFLLSRDGESAALFTKEKVYEKEEGDLLLLSLCRRRQGALYDLAQVPRAAARIAPLRRADGSEKCRYQRAILEDGLMGALLICAALKDAPLSALTADLPRTHILTREIPCRPEDKGRILRALCRESAVPRTLGEGVRFSHPGGYATVVPDDHRPALRITSEAEDTEFAQELCEKYLLLAQKAAESKNMEDSAKNIPFSP